MNVKKVNLLTVVVGLTSIVLTSCGGGIDPNPDWNIDVAANRENITLNTYFPASGKDNDFWQNSFIPQKLEEITGYKVNYNQTSEGSADTQVQAMLTGKENIDMLKIGPTLFNNYVTSGYFTDLTEGIQKYAPNLLTLSEITEEQWGAVTYEGKIFAIPEIGHTRMVNTALVWNMDHLKTVGINKMPQTVSELKTALLALQAEFGDTEKYGSNAANYHAFGLPGTMSEANPITPAFDVPSGWYIDENNAPKNMLFSDEMENYLKYMSNLKRAGCLTKGWSSQTGTIAENNFIQGYSSCVATSYWRVTPIRDSMIVSYKGFPKGLTKDEKRDYVYGVNETPYGIAPSDALIQWEVYLKGDGTDGSNVQAKGMARDSTGVGYFCTVPVANAKRAAYTLDWINSKQTEESMITIIAGEEGTHWEKSTKEDKDAIRLNTKEGEPEEYVKLLDKFYDDISGMSQYQTCVNPSVARKWWPVAEKGFNGWEVLVLDEERLILDPIALHPVLKEFAKVDLLARNHVVTQLQNCINKENDEAFDSTLQKARDKYISAYFYPAVENELTEWYQSTLK